MSSPRPVWTGVLTMDSDDEELARWILRSLEPEAAREVPRARASVRTVRRGRVEIVIEAGDAGAMRAALNTYLGWIGLSVAAAKEARDAVADRPESGNPEGVISRSR